MSNSKISALTSATTPLAGTEVLPIVQSGATVKVANNDLRPKQIQSNATSGVLQVVGPAAASTRVMTTPDANFTAARTDAAQSFTGDQTLSTGNAVIGTSGKGLTTGSSIPLGFGVNGSTSQVTIDTGGRFLIGTTSATTGGVTMASVLDARTANTGFGLGVIGDASNTQIMRFAYGATAVGSIVISSSTTTYNTISDQDLKNDLGVVTETDVIANTVIHDYEWKVDGGKARGPFAQEAHKVNPHAVTVGSDELDENGNKINPWQVDLSKYIPDIIVELQSLRKRVAELEDKG